MLAAAVIVGPVRDRAQRVYDALAAQTIARDIEIILVDLYADAFPRLDTSAHAATRYHTLPPTTAWGAARAMAARTATAPIVAFIEDHCFPASDWAERLVEAHAGPWAAVGYAFTNANPESYLSRCAMLVDYGAWAHPMARGPAKFLQNNNISYKRDLLLALEEPLEDLLAMDFNVQQAFTRRGHELFLEARALAAHHNFTDFEEMLEENHVHSRTMAAYRARLNRWSLARRLVYGLLTPVSAPLFRLVRLLASPAGRPAHWGTLAAALPILPLAFFWAGMGEALGYLFGEGRAREALPVSLLATERKAR